MYDDIAEDHCRLTTRAVETAVKDVAAVGLTVLARQPAVPGWAGGVKRTAQDDLDDVIGHVTIEIAAERPAQPVLVVLVTQRGDVADDIEDCCRSDRPSWVGQRYEDGIAISRIRSIGQAEGQAGKALRIRDRLSLQHLAQFVSATPESNTRDLRRLAV